MFSGWVNAGLTAAFVDAAIAKANALSREPIVCLPLYVDRFMANQQAARASPQVNARDERRRTGWAELTGNSAPEQPAVESAEVIDGHVKFLG